MCICKGYLFLFLFVVSLVGGSLAKKSIQDQSRITAVLASAQERLNTNSSVASTEVPHPPAHPKPADVQVGCKELRSKRYISDGFCTSVKPITEVVCTGHCLPMRDLPWYAEFVKVWARTKILEWRCVDDVVKRKRVRLLCENGESRSYRIKVVKSCKCKKYMKRHNMSRLDSQNQAKSSRTQKKRRPKGKNRKLNKSNRLRSQTKP